jgi:Starch-binding associating with outer membrane
MKYIKLSFVFALGLGFFTSCKHGQDLFVSPNNPTKATPQTLLTAAEVGTMNTYEGDLNRTAGVLVQHGVGVNGQATSTQVYALPQQLFDNQWSQIYQTLQTSQLFKTNFAAQNPWYDGIQDILMAMNWGVCTDLWGDIPYRQALNLGVYQQPKYDSQMVVINGILNLLDSAILKLSNDTLTNAFTPGADDIIFGGSRPKWVATAYTLKARYLNRFSNKGAAYLKDSILTCLSLGISSSAGDCMAIHGSQGQESNQWYAYYNGRSYILSCASLVDSMQSHVVGVKTFMDYRVNYFYADPSGIITGGDIDSPSASASIWGQYLMGPIDFNGSIGSSSWPTPLVTYTEALFIKAEVDYANGNTATAATDLNTAIGESFKKVTGFTDTSGLSSAYTAGNTDLSRIMFEKWIAMYGQIEVYNDYRRTGYPALRPVLYQVALTMIPKRFPTPDQESNYNPYAIIQDLTNPVWFAAH